MKVIRRDHGSVEIPMGPMIDMVFLLLVFFMVTSKPIQQESDISLSLPGTVEQEETVDIPDEQQIAVEVDGSIILNEMVIGAPGDTDLNQLYATLKRFREHAEANRAEALVTIAPADEALHQRIVDVLNACARAEITGVTFADTGGEEEL